MPEGLQYNHNSKGVGIIELEVEGVVWRESGSTVTTFGRRVVAATRAGAIQKEIHKIPTSLFIGNDTPMKISYSWKPFSLSVITPFVSGIARAG